MKTSVLISNWNGLFHMNRCSPAWTRQQYESVGMIAGDIVSFDRASEGLAHTYIFARRMTLTQSSGLSAGSAIAHRIATRDAIFVLNKDIAPKPKLTERLGAAAGLRDQICGAVPSTFALKEFQIDSANIGSQVSDRGFQQYRCFRCPRGVRLVAPLWPERVRRCIRNQPGRTRDFFGIGPL